MSSSEPGNFSLPFPAAMPLPWLGLLLWRYAGNRTSLKGGAQALMDVLNLALTTAREGSHMRGSFESKVGAGLALLTMALPSGVEAGKYCGDPVEGGTSSARRKRKLSLPRQSGGRLGRVLRPRIRELGQRGRSRPGVQ